MVFYFHSFSHVKEELFRELGNYLRSSFDSIFLTSRWRICSLLLASRSHATYDHVICVSRTKKLWSLWLFNFSSETVVNMKPKKRLIEVLFQLLKGRLFVDYDGGHPSCSVPFATSKRLIGSWGVLNFFPTNDVCKSENWNAMIPAVPQARILYTQSDATVASFWEYWVMSENAECWGFQSCFESASVESRCFQSETHFADLLPRRVSSQQSTPHKTHPKSHKHRHTDRVMATTGENLSPPSWLKFTLLGGPVAGFMLQDDSGPRPH